MGFWRRIFRREPVRFVAGPEPVIAPRVDAGSAMVRPADVGPGFTARQTKGLLTPGEAFTPTQPKTGRRRLVGREAELSRILQALGEDHAHVVLYSERGRGKTSLTNLVVEALRRSGSVVARHTCEASTTFDSMMRGLMDDLPPSLLAANVGFGHGERRRDAAGCADALPPGELRPGDVVMLPQRLDCRDLVCVVDEFDRILDPSTRTRLADTIKQLSDQDVKLRFLVVGVSENLDQILGQHPSIQRAILGVHLSLFSDRDVAQLIARGASETGLTFTPAVVARITLVARGMPYMAQLLGLRISQAAKARGDSDVTEEDFDTAVARLIDDATPRVVMLYASLTDHGRDAEMVLALRRLANAPQDAWGRLAVSTEPDGSVVAGGRPISASCWERLEAAHVLQPVMPGSDQFSFSERGVMHHALLLAAREAGLRDAGATEPRSDTRGELARDFRPVDSLSVQPAFSEMREPALRKTDGRTLQERAADERAGAPLAKLASMSRR